MTHPYLKTGRRILIIGLSLLLSAFCSYAQLTINVNSIPLSTPPNDKIYIAGTFNNWNPGNTSYLLTDHHDGTWSITFSPSAGQLEYKFTRGTWATVEGTAEGSFRPNRTFTYSGGVVSTEVSIAGWEDIIAATHTATANVQILDDNFYMPELDRHRRIWIYLPPDYETSTKQYPVFYMQDGQNLFDAYTSFAGEWKIDESMNTLFDAGDYGAIVVGIDNGGVNRTDEYCPWVNPTYGGGHGEAYTDFIVNTLKPYIDDHFRTRPGRDYTGIGGSSLGANISLFAAVEHQDVFSKVGVFSPAFWISDSIYQFIVHKGIHEKMRIYFVAGTTESTTMISDMQAVYDTLAFSGQDTTQMKFTARPDGAHSEWFWAREYPAAYTYLFRDLVLSTHQPIEKKGYVFPNPANESIGIKSDELNFHVTIYSLQGNKLFSDDSGPNTIDVSNLPQGIYFIEIKSLTTPGCFTSRFVKQ